MIPMNNKWKIWALLFLLFTFSSILSSQSRTSGSDTNMVFGKLKSPTIQQSTDRQYVNAMGVNVLVSTNGFGLGTFYRHEYTDDFAGFLDLSISEAKDDNEVEYFDPYTGQSYVPGKVNRFLLFPLMAGVQKRLFKDDILENFRPFLEAGAGPTMIYVFPYDEEYFTALGHGHPQYTYAAFAGFGAYFGERSNLMGLSFRYYYVPYPKGIQSFDAGNGPSTKTQFGGFYITLNFGNAW